MTIKSNSSYFTSSFGGSPHGTLKLPVHALTVLTGGGKLCWVGFALVCTVFTHVPGKVEVGRFVDQENGAVVSVPVDQVGKVGVK